MPYPSQISHEQLIRTASRIIEEQGVEAVTLGTIAKELGVKTPSLYRYVKGRTDLLRQVNLDFLNDLLHTVGAAARTGRGAEEVLLGTLVAFRQYAHRHPRLYLMSWAYMVDELRPDEDLLVKLVLPLQGTMAEVTGEARSLAALRSVLAYVHGFVMLELNHQLRRGGDLSADFYQGSAALLAGWRSETSV